MKMKRARTAAALVIGNELLTGKVRDVNVPPLARELFQLGIALRRVVICPDEIEIIARDLVRLRRGHDLVFTSGGVGPTHDDVTLEGVARAFGRPLVRSPEIEELLREFFGERFTTRHLRMARVPEGTELVVGRRGRWPLVLVENVFILPGLPEIFRRKLPVIAEHLAGAEPFITRAVGTRSDEGEIGDLLETLGREHPRVAIGSYPHWGDGPVRVTVTFDGRDGREVDQAVAGLVAALPPESLVEVEPATTEGAES